MGEHQVFLDVGDGYVLTCQTAPRVTVLAHGARRKTSQDLPRNGGYFLDGTFVYGPDARHGARNLGCDAVFCTRGATLTVELVAYESMPARPPPADAQTMTMAEDGHLSLARSVASYRRTELEGDVEVAVDYFADATCTTPKQLSKIVTAKPRASAADTTR